MSNVETSFQVRPSKEKIKDSEGFELNDDTQEATLYNEVVCKYIYSERWNLYFESLYGIKIDFEITPRSQPYFTPLDCRRHLDIVVQPLFPEPPVVVDVTCGIGGDLADFILNWNGEQYFGIDSMDDQEFGTLKSNLEKIVTAFPKDFPGGPTQYIKIANEGGDGSEWKSKISLHQKTASAFLKEYGAHLKREKIKHGTLYKPPRILIYADPTWNAQKLIDATYEELMTEELRKNVERQKVQQKTRKKSTNTDEILENEGTPDVIMNYIITCILKPMRKANIPCNVFCVKVRWDITQKMMQERLNEHEELKDHFIVLYSVQAIPNVPGTKLYKEERKGNNKIVIFDKKGKEAERKPENFGAVKGIFHWIVMKCVDYMYIRHERTLLYEQECIQSQPVFVEEESFLKGPFKPRYSDHMPFPTVITKKDYDLPSTEKKLYRKIGPAKTWEEVKLIDVETYIDKLQTLKREYDEGDAIVKTDVSEKIRKILILCEAYVTGEDNLEIAKSELQTEIAEKIKELKEMAQKLHEVLNDGYTVVPKRGGGGAQTSQRRGFGRKQGGRGGAQTSQGGRGLKAKKSDLGSGYDERLELLHQLQVIFET